MADPKFVAFSTQKGGAGKTTLTVLAASYLYYVKGLKVLVVDCDYPQFSIEEMRQRDRDLIECSPQFKKLFSDNMRQTKLAPYPLLTAKPEEARSAVVPFSDLKACGRCVKSSRAAMKSTSFSSTYPVRSTTVVS